ncbi:MAG: Rab family GTPase [Candidatus Thorarchaeota archaeon]|jgi:small GTP-binding protein
MSPAYLLKIVTVGAASVGKTSMIVRYSTGAFREHYSPTLGTGFAFKKMKVDEDFVNLQIWDMGSQDFLERVRSNYYMGAFGAIFVYDVTSWESLNAVQEWQEEVDRNLEEYKAILVANKIDLVVDRVVSTEEGSQMAKSLDMKYMETSVRLNRNVNETFQLISKDIIEWLF